MTSFFTDFWDDHGDSIVDVLINIAIALVMLVVGVYVIRWISHLLQRMFEANRKLDPTVATFLLSICRFALRFILLIMIFGQLGIENTSFIAIAGASVFALAFALQGSLSNLAAGAMLLSFRYLKVGDLVQVAGEMGYVRRVEIFTSQLVTADGKLIIVPNGSITGNNIVNLSTLNAMRLPLAIGIDYGDDIHLARRVAMDVMHNNSMVLTEPAPTAVVVELGDNSVNFEVRPWVEAKHYYKAMVEVLEELKLAFDEAGLSIPFPQRDVHLNLVDTDEGPKSYPNWVPLKRRPGGADRFFRRMQREPTGIFKMLQLSDADQARYEAEAEEDAAADEANEKARQHHFLSSSSIPEGGGGGDSEDDDVDGEEEEATPRVLDVDAEIEMGGLDGDDDVDEAKADLDGGSDDDDEEEEEAALRQRELAHSSSMARPDRPGRVTGAEAGSSSALETGADDADLQGAASAEPAPRAAKKKKNKKRRK